MVVVDTADVVETLQRRGDVLGQFDGDPVDKAGLEERVEVSRSTLDRAVRELEEAGFVERTDCGYRRTTSGHLALTAYEQFHGRMHDLVACSGLLRGLPPGTDVPWALVEGADVVRASRASPHQPVERLYGLVERADAVRGFAPSIHPRQVETYREQIEDGGMAAQLVVTEEVLSHMVAAYGEAYEWTLEFDRVELWQSAGSLPYSLTLAETPDGPVVAVMVYADEGIKGCIVNDSSAAVEWGRRRYDRELGRATRVDGPDRGGT